MARDFIDRVEDEIDERLSGEHPRRYGDSDGPASGVDELQREQHREAEEMGGAPGVPMLTGPQSRGMVWGALIGAVIGAIVIAPVALIPMYDLSLAVRLVIAVAIGAAGGATAGAVYFGSRAPELSGESLDADNTPSAGSTLANPKTDSKGR